MRRSREEKSLLKRLSAGEFDGTVGDVLETSGGSTVWTSIKDGEPVRYKKGPGGKFFNGKENERYDGVLHTLEEYDTDEKKVGFFQKFGWLIDDDEAKSYSAKFKPTR